MPFLTPLALLGLVFLPAVVAMYLLKLRRDEALVPSTLLWQRLVADVEANAPWQRLRRSLLLLIQLLLVAILAILAARPFMERPAGLAGDIVLVVDTSASMAATDVAPNRLTAAKAAAVEALRELPAGAKVSVIAAGGTARVVVNGTSDIGRVRAAIDGLTVFPAAGDLGDALRLADALAARSAEAEILVATDAAVARTPEVRLDHAVRVLPVGRGRANQAVVALAVRTAPSGVTRSVFVSVANLDIEPATRRLEIWGDGVLLEVREIFLDPQTRSEAIVDDVPLGVGVVEVRLNGETGDMLALDDRAWAVVPPDRLREILLVSEGDPYLETALSYLPNSVLYGVQPGDYPAKAARTDGREWDLIVFEGPMPKTLPQTAILAIGPTASSPLGEVVGTLTDPGLGPLDAAEPILRYVDLSTTHVGTASKLVLPDWARSIIPGPANAPLLYVGQLGGRPAAVLAFEPRMSDLPLQVAFPILIANLTGELLGGSAAPVESVVPGTPVDLPVPAGATGLLVTRPDGSTVELAPGVTGGGTVAFTQTELLGVYSAAAIYPDATPAPTAGPSGATPDAGSPTASPSAGPGSPTPAPTAPPVDPNAPVLFAVDLFDPGESNIAPGSATAIEALGNLPTEDPSHGASADASTGPTASPSGSGGAASTPPPPVARDELWIPVLLLALVVLVAEWLLYHRDAALRIRRGLAARLGREA